MLNPESIDLTAIPSVALCEHATLPRVPVIYFCLSEAKEVLYIGKSVNSYSRWKGHHKMAQIQAAGGVRISYLVTDKNLLDKVERALIYYFDPPLNNRTDQVIDTPMSRLRERAGLRTVDVASKLGVAESTVRNWDVGRHTPRLPIEDIPSFLEAYQCTLEEAISAAEKSRRKFDASHS